jgi:hypothetical protein
MPSYISAAGFGPPTISIASACGNTNPLSVKKTTARRMRANRFMLSSSRCEPTGFDTAGRLRSWIPEALMDTGPRNPAASWSPCNTSTDPTVEARRPRRRHSPR